MNTRLVWLPVRCCCKPDSLLGFMRLPETALAHSYLEIEGHGIEIKPLTTLKPSTIRDHFDAKPSEFSSLTLGDTEVELAIYSDDRPLAFWRQFREFVEVR